MQATSTINCDSLYAMPINHTQRPIYSCFSYVCSKSLSEWVVMQAEFNSEKWTSADKTILRKNKEKLMDAHVTGTDEVVKNTFTCGKIACVLAIVVSN